MDWQASYLQKLDRDVADLKAEFRASEQRIGARIDQFLGEMRHLDNQRQREALSVREEIKHDIQGISQRLDEERRWVKGLLLTTIVGITAIALTVIVTLVAPLFSDSYKEPAPSSMAPSSAPSTVPSPNAPTNSVPSANKP